MSRLTSSPPPQLEASGSGFTELSKALMKLIPGFNSPRPHGAPWHRPCAPLYLARTGYPDQVLVLVNGKRLHQSPCSMSIFRGPGHSGVDINTIPLRSIERIEVLRDGAAAQYGSDAIAGIINVILKGYGHDSRASVSYGRTTGRWRGPSGRCVLFCAAEDDGFFNVTAEARDRGRTNRAGPDSRSRQRHQSSDRGDRGAGHAIRPPMWKSRPCTHLFMRTVCWIAATAVPVHCTAYPPMPAQRRVIPKRFFSPSVSSLRSSTTAKWTRRGARYVRCNLSLTHGMNDYHFYVSNTHNDSLGNGSPTSFDSGATNYRQDILAIRN